VNNKSSCGSSFLTAGTQCAWRSLVIGLLLFIRETVLLLVVVIVVVRPSLQKP